MSIPKHHPYAFDPTYGFGLAELLAVRQPPAPPGFDDFWRARYLAAREIDPKPRLSSSAATHPDWRVEDIRYTSTGGFDIGGWLLRPRQGEISHGLVVGHGYGGRDQPDFDLPVANAAVLFPCFRGLSRSRRPGISTDPAFHVLHDIGDPKRYILGGCVEDLWLGVSALTRLHPELGDRVGYMGTSFGGGIGALAIPDDPRIVRGHLTVPTFGNMPLWQSLPTTGSGQSVQRYLKTHGEARASLDLFDAAVAAARIRVPVLAAVACFDPAVAPPCQFSVANALTSSNGHETVILDAGHFDYPGMQEQQELLTAKTERFFRPL